MRWTVVLLLVGLFVLAPGQAQQPASSPEPAAEAEGPPRPAYVDAAKPCADAKNFRDSGFEPNGADDPVENGPSGAAVDGEGPVSATTPRVSVVADFDDDEQTEHLDFYFNSFAGHIHYDHEDAGAAQTMEVQFEGVFEFRDSDGDGRYDEGEPVLQSFFILPNRLHHADWWSGPCGMRLLWTYYLTATMEEIDAQLEAGDEAALEAQPRMALRFTHLQEEAVQDGVVLRPERVKLDIIVENFPFTASDTRIGVRSWAAAEEASARDREVQGGEGGSLVYRWAVEAEAGGAVVPVAVSVTTTRAPTHQLTEDAMAVVFGYPRTASLLHDPEMGLQSLFAHVIEAIRKGDPMAYGVGVGVGLVLLGAAAVRRPPV